MESPLPYGKALLALPSSSSSITTRTLAIQERGWSFTGEDFDVFALDNGNGAESSNVGVCKIRGALLHLPGKDKMRLLDNDGKTVLAVLDRKLVALSTTYDVYRGGEGDTAAVNQIGWIQKKIGFAFRECFEVYCYSQQSPEAPKSKETLCYKLQGDFLEREFFMTDQSANNNIVAVVSKKGWFRLPSFLDKDATDFYPVQVAPGMDVGLVIACVAVVDEELDEEHQKKKKEREKQNSKSEEGKNGWFG